MYSPGTVEYVENAVRYDKFGMLWHRDNIIELSMIDIKENNVDICTKQ